MIKRIIKKLYKTRQDKIDLSWKKVGGDKTLRLNYDINKDSIVFDIGGYEGQWSSDIFSKYCPKIHIFEPIKEFANKISERFKKNDKIIVHDFGLINKTIESSFSLNNDSSSLFLKTQNTTIVKLRKASDFIKENKFNKIDLMKINIEGSEYDLMDDLINNDLIKNISNIQIQFHNFVPDAKTRMEDVQRKLKQTHRITYQYPFVWENWELIK